MDNGQSDFPRPRFGPIAGGHLLLHGIVSFPISLLIAWVSLRFIVHVAFNTGDLAMLLSAVWAAVSLIDAAVDYVLVRASDRISPLTPWLVTLVKMLLPFALPWPMVLLYNDVIVVAVVGIVAGAIRLMEVILLEQPWNSEDKETVNHRIRDLRNLNREMLEEIRKERRERMSKRNEASTYDPYGLRGKHY
ncbi:hypothetical protein JS530_00330 [Bifidobacterium sp. LC6]|uniref:Uncharacterized protein n=1 Tax=Bifidobacterium colobi TaxID=2809026 RepID=A0ABS5USQ6_9BIFI|nr:hypothetical protein [Bifidobacterium colobi]MBT1173982.1 hypothetical protein [Bifidobacterium colobi]